MGWREAQEGPAATGCILRALWAACSMVALVWTGLGQRHAVQLHVAPAYRHSACGGQRCARTGRCTPEPAGSGAPDTPPRCWWWTAHALVRMPPGRMHAAATSMVHELLGEMPQQGKRKQADASASRLRCVHRQQAQDWHSTTHRVYRHRFQLQVAMAAQPLLWHGDQHVGALGMTLAAGTASAQQRLADAEWVGTFTEGCAMSQVAWQQVKGISNHKRLNIWT